MGAFDWAGSSSKAGGAGHDVESAGLLAPGLNAIENSERWGFVRKVYGIVGAQLALTAVVGGIVTGSETVRGFFGASLLPQILLLVASIGLLIPLYLYQDRHPENLLWLGAWTAVMSVTVGLACSLYAPGVVLEAVAITAAVVAGLVAYAHWATRRGVDFTPFAPLLSGALWALIIWGFVQIFFHPGPVGRTIFALLGAVLFAFYLVLDVQLVATRFELDAYVWASVTVYLDVINLFLRILQLLGDRRD